MLTSRIVEGIGMGLIAVVAPAVIAMWFPAEKRGVPMGLWATWVPVGTLVIYNLAPMLAAGAGWQAVWWFGAAFSLFTFIIYWLFVRMPPASERIIRETIGTGLTTEIDKQPSLGKAMANRNIWLLSFDFCCFNATFMAVSTFLPTFLVSVRGYSLGLAAFVTSLAPMVCLLSCPVGGLLSDRLGTRKWFYTVPFVIVAVMWLFPFTISGWLIPAYIIVLGIISGPVATATFAAVPEILKQPQLAGIGMAIVMLGQNLGMLAGPAVFGNLAESVGWATAGYMLIPVSVLGIVAGWLVKVR
jgi:nitrate/nitrite transporter NarK